MSYYDVRLVTKSESIEVLKQLLEKSNGKTMADILECAHINKTFGNIVYLGWNHLISSSTNLIESSMVELEDQELSYRLTLIGGATEEIEESYYTSPPDEELDIPFPSVIRTFDEKDMEMQLKGYDNYIKREDEKEIIEYE